MEKMILYYYILVVAMVFHELGHYICASHYYKDIKIVFQFNKNKKILGTEIPECVEKDKYQNILVSGMLLGFVVLIIGLLSIPNFNFYVIFLICLVYLLLCNKDIKEFFK